MIAVVLLLFVNVCLRYVFGYAIPWAEEVTRYFLLWTVFVGSAVISREGTHVSMDAFFNMWPERLRKLGFAAITALCIVTMGFLLYLGSGMVWMVIDTGQTSEAAYFPMWIIYAAIPVGSALMILGFLEAGWRQWTGRPLAKADISHAGRSEGE